MQQVILNLIMNAIEAMSGVSQAHQELSVASMKDGSSGVLVVEAHGGQLWATLNVPRGAIFQFRLPTDGEEVSSSKQMQSSS